MSKGFFIGTIYIYYYSIIIVVASIIGLMVCKFLAQKKGIIKQDILDFYFISMTVGLICARLYYVIFNINFYKQDLLQIFNLRNGGLAIYGGIIGGFITAIIFCKIKKINIINLLDSITPSLLISQSIGRWGNFINQEAYGYSIGNTLKDGENFFRFFHIPDFIKDNLLIDNMYHHPTFLYESIWCLLGFLLIFSVILFKKKITPLLCVCFYLIWYGIGRFFIEALRMDSLYMQFGIRISQYLSVLLVFIGIFLYIFFVKNKTRVISQKKY